MIALRNKNISKYAMLIVTKIVVSVLFVTIALVGQEELLPNVQVVDRPYTSYSNDHYVSNRPPLQPSAFIKLPVGAVHAEGWLQVYLQKQRDGLTGHLGEISAWLQREDNAWLSKDGSGKWGWEELPYWLKGYANLGYILDDKKIIDEAEFWLQATIDGQRDDGNFGPLHLQHDGSLDFWGNMVMLYCLQSYYEYSKDVRVLELMTRYFKFQLDYPEDKFLTLYWQKIRGGDNLHSVFWLYNRTGEPFLLQLAEKIHRCTADWSSRGNSLSDIHNHKEIREGMEWPQWYGDLIDWHNVNHAQSFREPAQYFLLSGKQADLNASYENFKIMRDHFGQVPGGMFGADENARPGYDDPRQGIETCGIVEQLNSDEHMLRITGDPFWADHAEEVAFNTYPAATMADFKALRYITSPNMVLCDDGNHYPGIANKGPFLMMNPFSSRCCQHNHSQGWPYYVENLWMATPDNGLVLALYGASTVTAKVGNGVEVTINEKTHYPFEESVNLTIETDDSVLFPLYVRIPDWCDEAEIKVNGGSVITEVAGGRYVRIERIWNHKDEVSLLFPMNLSVKIWENNHNSASVYLGPLTFSLKIKEDYVRKDSEETAIGDSRWQKDTDKSKWPSWEIRSGSDWNYGLVFDPDDLENSFEVIRREWPEDDYPFTAESVPLVIKTKGKKINEWKLDEHDLCGELMESPVVSMRKTEEIELIPMGAARLRISAFPVIRNSN